MAPHSIPDRVLDCFEHSCLLSLDENLTINDFAEEEYEETTESLEHRILQGIKKRINSIDHYPFRLRSKLLEFNPDLPDEGKYAYLFLLACSPNSILKNENNKKDLENQFEDLSSKCLEIIAKKESKSFYKVGTIGSTGKNLASVILLLSVKLGIGKGVKDPAPSDKDCGVDCLIYCETGKRVELWQSTVQSNYKQKLLLVDIDRWTQFLEAGLTYTRNIAVPYLIAKKSSEYDGSKVLDRQDLTCLLTKIFKVDSPVFMEIKNLINDIKKRIVETTKDSAH